MNQTNPNQTEELQELLDAASRVKSDAQTPLNDPTKVSINLGVDIVSNAVRDYLKQKIMRPDIGEIDIVWLTKDRVFRADFKPAEEKSEIEKP